MKIKLLLVIVVGAAILLSGCGDKSISTVNTPTITVSLEPQKYFLDKIVGDKTLAKKIERNIFKIETK